MSIHRFSEQAFNDTVKEILLKEHFLRDASSRKPITDSEQIATDTSLRQSYDLTSLDIAEIIISLEEKYNVKTIETGTNKIDSIDDIRKLFMTSLKNMRTNFRTKQQIQKIKQSKDDKMLKKEILDSLTKIILNRDTTLSPKDISSSSSLKHDLNMDSLDVIETLMEFEKEYDVFFEDSSKLNNVNTLGEFVQVLYDFMNPEKAPQQITKEYIFEILQNHLYNRYGSVPEVKRNSNWYTDLGLGSFERTELYAWIEEKFAVRVPFLYFKNMDVLCEKVYQEIKAKENKQLSLLNRVKQKFNNFTQNIRQNRNGR